MESPQPLKKQPEQSIDEKDSEFFNNLFSSDGDSEVVQYTNNPPAPAVEYQKMPTRRTEEERAEADAEVVQSFASDITEKSVPRVAPLETLAPAADDVPTENIFNPDAEVTQQTQPLVAEDAPTDQTPEAVQRKIDAQLADFKTPLSPQDGITEVGTADDIDLSEFMLTDKGTGTDNVRYMSDSRKPADFTARTVELPDRDNLLYMSNHRKAGSFEAKTVELKDALTVESPNTKRESQEKIAQAKADGVFDKKTEELTEEFNRPFEGASADQPTVDLDRTEELADPQQQVFIAREKANGTFDKKTVQLEKDQPWSAVRAETAAKRAEVNRKEKKQDTIAERKYKESESDQRLKDEIAEVRERANKFIEQQFGKPLKECAAQDFYLQKEAYLAMFPDPKILDFAQIREKIFILQLLKERATQLQLTEYKNYFAESEEAYKNRAIYSRAA